MLMNPQAAPRTPLIEVKGLRHLYHKGSTPDLVVLDGVEMTLWSGEIVGLLGRSGSGKSTLLRSIAGLLRPTDGSITFEGTPIRGCSEGVSMVFQSFALFPWLTVLENVEIGLEARGMAHAERRKRALAAIDLIGLDGFENAYPKELSGGMRQRVGLARALATDADILIMDEAFSALDPLIRTEMQDELLRLQRTLHKTILFITHDFQEALKLGTRIAIMADGAVVREGTPQEIVTDPGSDYVAAFTREVDRSRLFDARSVMVEARPIVARADGTVELAGVSGLGRSFVVDDAGRLIGTVAAADLPRLQQGITLRSLASADCATVPGHARLADIAGACSGDQLVAVIDEDGRLLGRVEPGRILARIAAPAALAQP